MSQVIIFIFFTVVAKGNLLEYNLRASVGQITFDVSENNLHANSGSTLLKESNDPISTDRGSYFSQAQILSLPPNSIRPQTLLPIQSNFLFTITFKALASGCLFSITNSLSEKIALCIDSDSLKYSQNGLYLVDSNFQYIWTTVIFGFSSGDHSSCNSLGMILYLNYYCLTIPGTSIQTQITDNAVLGTNFLTNQFFKGFIASVYLFSDFESALAKYNSITLPNGSDLPLYTISGVACNCGTYSCILDSPDVCNKCEDSCGDFCESIDKCSDIRELCDIYYYDSVEGICDDNILYIIGCVSQSSSILCLQCDNGWILSPLGDTCYEDRTYFSDRNCLECFMDCKTCDGVTDKDCLSCNDPNAYVNSSGKCKCNSPDYKSISIDPLVCGYKTCHNDCIDCIGPNADDCFSCTESNAFVLVSPGHCVCKSGYYESISDPLKCSTCHQDCKECLGSGQSQCLSCNEVNAEVLNPPNSCQCLENYYAISANPLSCSSCHLDCMTCTGPLQTQCLSCNEVNAEVLNPPNGCQCLESCYAISANPLSCSSCHLDCMTCTGPLQTQCLSCNEVNAEVLNPPNSCQCLESCYAISANPLSCSSCHLDCMTCTGPLQTQCSLCSDSNAIVSSQSSLCICESGYYEISLNPLVCDPCYSSCESCQGPLYNECISCLDTNAILSSSPGYCICKLGYYASLLDPLTCSQCSSNCYECSGPLDSQCLSCPNNAFVLYPPGECICDSGYYKESTSPLICSICNVDCSECSGPLDTECLACNDENSEIIETCVCKVGYYASTLSPLVCEICNIDCYECDGPLNTNCISCSDQLATSVSGNCKCIDQTYIASTNPLICGLCSEDCASCSNVGNSNCLSCVDPYAKIFSIPGHCSCPDYFYAISQSPLECSQCHSDCKSCTGPNGTDCLECSDMHSFLSILNVCECISGYYPISQNPLICGSCYKNCLNCNGPSQYNCTQCIDDFSQEVTIYGNCSCKDGYYSVSGNKLLCWPCSFECLTCFGGEKNQCSSCKDFNASPFKGLCTCNQGYYKRDELCMKCKEACLSCTSSDFCTSCIDSSMILDSGECQCPPSSYFNTNHCDSCAEGCKECKNLNFCSKCSESYYMYNNLCYPCHSTCISCVGPNFDNCTKCALNLTLSENACYCKQGKFMTSNFTCSSCMKNCLKCSEIDVCEECEENYLFSADEKKCINYTEKESISVIENYIKSAGSVVMSIVTASAATSAFMNNQPSLVWTTLNTAQVLCYIPLHNIALPSVLSSFYKSIQPINIVPNFWKTQFYYECNSMSIIQPFRDYGYTCMYFITNTGEISLTFTLLVFLLLLFLMLRLITCGKTKSFFNEKIKKYRWNYFIRFWLESFLDIIIPCVISLNNLSLSSINEIANSTLGFVFSILTLASPIICFIFIFNCYPSIKENNQNLYNKYGCIYSEFIQDKGMIYLMYYPYFLLRRSLYIFVFYYLQFSPLSQIIINTTHSIITVLFICKYKPFKEKKYNLYNIVQETIIVFSFILTGLFILDLSTYSMQVVTVLLIILAVMSIAIGYGLLGYTIFIEIRKRLRQRRAAINTGYSIPRFEINAESHKKHEIFCKVEPISPLSVEKSETCKKIFVSRRNSFDSIIPEFKL